MTRVQVLENGKILPGQEENFKLAAHKEGLSLKKIDARFRKEDPDLYKDIPEVTNWDIEGAHSLISAACRLGVGDFCMEFDDEGNYINFH